MARTTKIAKMSKQFFLKHKFVKFRFFLNSIVAKWIKQLKMIQLTKLVNY